MLDEGRGTGFSRLAVMVSSVTRFPLPQFWFCSICLLALQSSPARAQSFLTSSFSAGLSLTGAGDFGTGILSTGIPGQLGVELRLEALNLIARGVSLRANLGSSGLEGLVFWRADLSESFNLTLGAGFGWLDYAAPGLVARVGLEYRLDSFAVALEYGWRSSFATDTPTLRSSWALGFIWFFGR
jgi:hypothetical protein